MNTHLFTIYYFKLSIAFLVEEKKICFDVCRRITLNSRHFVTARYDCEIVIMSNVKYKSSSLNLIHVFNECVSHKSRMFMDSAENQKPQAKAK